MASLFIKDAEAANSVRSMAKRLGTTQTEAVRRGMRALERTLQPLPVETADQPARQPEKQDFVEWLQEHRRLNPLPPRTGPAADKAFFDWLSGEEDVHDPFR